jgi:hypothetical protein
LAKLVAALQQTPPSLPGDPLVARGRVQAGRDWVRLPAGQLRPPLRSPRPRCPSGGCSGEANAAGAAGSIATLPRRSRYAVKRGARRQRPRRGRRGYARPRETPAFRLGSGAREADLSDIASAALTWHGLLGSGRHARTLFGDWPWAIPTLPAEHRMWRGRGPHTNAHQRPGGSDRHAAHRIGVPERRCHLGCLPGGLHCAGRAGSGENDDREGR